MKTPAPADLQRWSDELARNPASLAFLPLARAYRRLGRKDLAMRLCLRGLEEHPANVEAHALLALLYLERGERERAADEWSIVLRLKPGNFEALRGMGFRYLEENDIPRARQHLERAALIRPADAAVQEALRLLRQREASARLEEVGAEPASAPQEDEMLTLVEEVWTPDLAGFPSFIDEDPAAAGAQGAAAAEPIELREEDVEPWAVAPADEAERHAEAVDVRAEPAPRRGTATAIGDPGRVFETLMIGPILGALLLDARGLVLAGNLRAEGSADDIGAIIGGAVDEAKRTVSYLELGGWRGFLMEAQSAVIHVSPVHPEATVVLAAEPGAPTGWILRTAEQAGRLAARFLEAYP